MLTSFLLPFAQLSETLSKFLSAQVTVETDRERPWRVSPVGWGHGGRQGR